MEQRIKALKLDPKESDEENQVFDDSDNEEVEDAKVARQGNEKEKHIKDPQESTNEHKLTEVHNPLFRNDADNFEDSHYLNIHSQPIAPNQYSTVFVGNVNSHNQFNMPPHNNQSNFAVQNQNRLGYIPNMPASYNNNLSYPNSMALHVNKNQGKNNLDGKDDDDTFCFGLLRKSDPACTNICRMICIILFSPFVLLYYCAKKCLAQCEKLCRALGQCIEKIINIFTKCLDSIYKACCNCFVCKCIRSTCKFLAAQMEKLCSKICAKIFACCQKLGEILQKCLCNERLCSILCMPCKYLCKCLDYAMNRICNCIEKIANCFTSIFKEMCRLLGKLLKLIERFIKWVCYYPFKILKFIFKIIKELLKAVYKVISAIVKAILKVIGEILKTIGKIVQAILKPIGKMISKIADSISRAFKGLFR